ncbi:hypothetical protein KKF64_01240 [Patescibacteria group bacterium]|nr:hypothetical protein [Patescibacteria group bacterium]
MAQEAIGPIAVSIAEFLEFGCAYCGFNSGSATFVDSSNAVWRCHECDRECVVLTEGAINSPFGFRLDEDFIYYPELEDHPRRGIPAHEIK